MARSTVKKASNAATAAKRAPVALAQARKPAQSRSRIRFQRLLDATCELLMDGDFTNVGLYDIAERAEAPPASVYHFFPTKEAAFQALAERYLTQMEAEVGAPIPPEEITHWSDLIKIRFGRTIDFYNRHPVARKLFLGGTVSAEIRRADVDYVSNVSALTYDWMNEYLIMPYVHDSFSKFSVIIGIFDGIWMLSYGRHGAISDLLAEEAYRAAIAYMKTFLPEVIPLRAPDEIAAAQAEAQS